MSYSSESSYEDPLYKTESSYARGSIRSYVKSLFLFLFLLLLLIGDDDDDNDVVVERYKPFFNDDFVDELTFVETDDDVSIFLVCILDDSNWDIVATTYYSELLLLHVFSSSH